MGGGSEKVKLFPKFKLFPKYPPINFDGFPKLTLFKNKNDFVKKERQVWQTK